MGNSQKSHAQVYTGYLYGLAQSRTAQYNTWLHCIISSKNLPTLCIIQVEVF